MAFAEGEFIFLVDDDDQRHWMKVSYSMLKIQLGTIDGNRFREMDDGDRMMLAGKAFTAFRPGTKDLMESVERGAQIIMPKDAATIIMDCDIKGGDFVLEVGAGSGSMSIALLKAVSPSGKVHTVELREDYAQRAQKNIRRAGLECGWSYQIGDAKTAEVSVTADALVMDMPDPWLAYDNLLGCLRSGGRICLYVPNMNQVESAVVALRDRGFFDVHTVENIQREMEVHRGGVRPSFGTLGHTGYMVFGRKRN